VSSAKRKRQADVLRISRKIHRTTGAVLFVFFFVTACTGLLLGWKKHSGGIILPKSYQGKSTDPKDWLSLQELHTRAVDVVRTRIDPELSLEIERIDVRPDKGMVKFVFVDDYWGIQLDCTTGELLHIERRRSDFIENIHDGSVLDILFKTNYGQIKLVYTTVLGTALLMFTLTGFWLWYGPKQFRGSRRRWSRNKT